MMFITPMPPSASVTRLTTTKKVCIAPIILPNITAWSAVFHIDSASGSFGSKSWRGASTARMSVSTGPCASRPRKPPIPSRSSHASSCRATSGFGAAMIVETESAV